MQQPHTIRQQNQPPQRLPMGMRVANAMQKTGVVGLPRNYEIFYAAISGTNAELQRQLMDFGTNLDQQKLDHIYSLHFGRSDDETVVLRVCNTIEEQLAQSLTTLEKGNISVSNFGNILEQGKAKLDPKLRLPPKMVGKIADLLISATETAKQQGKQALKEIETGSAQLNKMKVELAEYKRLAETDPLTGLYNRRAFDDQIADLNGAAMKSSAIIIGDIDKFKVINDTYGHPFGDTVIKTVAQVTKANSREEVFCARIGGEEFALISHNIDEKGVCHLAERLRVAIAETSFTDGRTRLAPGRITISYGVCHGSNAPDSATLYSQADEALYVSKRISRNRVTSHSELTVSPDRKDLFLYRD